MALIEMNVNRNNSKHIRMTEMLEALESINRPPIHKPSKKTKSLTKRKSVKAKKASTMKNRTKTMRNRLKAKRAQRLSEKRLKVIGITEHGEEGIEQLVKKLKKLQKLYDASSVEKQSDISVYLSMLTTEVQAVFQKEFQDEYKEEYPDLFDTELAELQPIEYIEELIDFLDDMLDDYHEKANNNSQIALDITAEVILEVISQAGVAFNKLGQTNKSETVNALINIFGGLEV